MGSVLFLSIDVGINDWVASKTDGDKLPQAAQVVLNQIELLASPPTNARSFLITDAYGRGTQDTPGDAWKLQIYNGLGALHLGSPSLNFAYVDFEPLWEGILGITAPGFKAFGYTSIGSCTLNSSSTAGACDGETKLVDDCCKCLIGARVLFPRSGPHSLRTFSVYQKDGSS